MKALPGKMLHNKHYLIHYSHMSETQFPMHWEIVSRTHPEVLGGISPIAFVPLSE
jgi:hypothetical protein